MRFLMAAWRSFSSATSCALLALICAIWSCRTSLVMALSIRALTMRLRNGSNGTFFDLQNAAPAFFFLLQVSSLPCLAFFTTMLGGVASGAVWQVVHLTRSLRGLGLTWDLGEHVPALPASSMDSCTRLKRPSLTNGSWAPATLVRSNFLRFLGNFDWDVLKNSDSPRYARLRRILTMVLLCHIALPFGLGIPRRDSSMTMSPVVLPLSLIRKIIFTCSACTSWGT